MKLTKNQQRMYNDADNLHRDLAAIMSKYPPRHAILVLLSEQENVSDEVLLYACTQHKECSTHSLARAAHMCLHSLELRTKPAAVAVMKAARK